MEFNESFFRDVLRSDGVRNVVVAAAERVADQARSSAPVDSGDYRDSIHVEVKYQQRVVAQVVADDPKSMIIESKTGNLSRSVRGA